MQGLLGVDDRQGRRLEDLLDMDPLRLGHLRDRRGVAQLLQEAPYSVEVLAQALRHGCDAATRPSMKFAEPGPEQPNGSG